MAFPLPHYAKIKDNYCIVYQGPNDEFVTQLIRVRPYIEEQLPGIKIYIACKDELTCSAKGQKTIFAVSTLKERRNQFAYIRHLKNNLRDNPVKQLLEESGLLTPQLEKMFDEK
jgi:hypothetical protein